LPIYDRVAIDFAIKEAVDAGAKRIAVVISAAKTAIRDYLSADPSKAVHKTYRTADMLPRGQHEVVYVFQDAPKGLGHAVLCCKDAMLPGPFGVILPDDIIMGANCLAEMATHFDSGQMVAAMQVKPEETVQYGIFRLSGLPKSRCIPVSGMVEKPASCTAPPSIAAVGRYILDPMIFNVLAHTPYGAGGELQLTDAIAIATHAVPLTAFQFSGVRYDYGNHDGLLSASVARQARVRKVAVEYNAPPAVSVSVSEETYAMVRRPDRDARSVGTAASAR
jgi:UTP--glucose-1-phosphate uridylyltransferase